MLRKILFLVSIIYALVSFGQEQPPSNLSGAELRQWLKTNWYSGKFSNQGYDGARSAMYSNIDKRSDGRVYCVYTGFNQNSANTTFLNPINAEHTIPQSWFSENEPMKSDIFHLYPTHGNVNSARSNKPFDEIPDNETNTWYTGNSTGITSTSSIPSTNIDDYSENDSNSFEPREDHKGDVARSAFYFFTMYDISSTSGKTINSVIADGDLETLYEWHINDPVDAWEQQRNERIAAVQGNRNPFIDYPEIACRAWGLSCSSVPNPALNLQQALQMFQPTLKGEKSASQSYNVSGQNFVGDLTISASSHFKISLDNSTFASSLTITPVSGELNRSVYVRFEPTGNVQGLITGSISHTSSNLTTINLSVSGEVQENLVPKIILTESLTDFGVVSFGNESDSQSYHVDCENFNENLTIDVSDHFQISRDGQNYSQQIILQHANGVIDTDIFVKFAPIENLNTAVPGTITHSSSLDDVIINIIGVELNENIQAGITVDEQLNDFGMVLLGESSAIQTYVVSGGQLTDDLHLTASDGFLISVDGINFSQTLTVIKTGDVVNQTVISIKFEPNSEVLGVYTGTINHTSVGHDAVEIRVTGTAYEIVPIIPELTFRMGELELIDYSSVTVYLIADEPLTEDYNVNLVLANASNISYGTNGFTTNPPIENGLLKLTFAANQDSTAITFNFNSNMELSKSFELQLGILGGQAYTTGEFNQISLKYAQAELTFNTIETMTLFYPNPANNWINIPVGVAMNKIKLTDVAGRNMKYETIDSDRLMVFPNLESGVYFIQFEIDSNHLMQRLLIRK